MAIIQKTIEDIKRYIGSNEQTDDARKEEALRALSLFMCPQVAENRLEVNVAWMRLQEPVALPVLARKLSVGQRQGVRGQNSGKIKGRRAKGD